MYEFDLENLERIIEDASKAKDLKLMVTSVAASILSNEEQFLTETRDMVHGYAVDLVTTEGFHPTEAFTLAWSFTLMSTFNKGFKEHNLPYYFDYTSNDWQLVNMNANTH